MTKPKLAWALLNKKTKKVKWVGLKRPWIAGFHHYYHDGHGFTERIIGSKETEKLIRITIHLV